MKTKHKNNNKFTKCYQLLQKKYNSANINVKENEITKTKSNLSYFHRYWTHLHIIKIHVYYSIRAFIYLK